MCECVSLLVRSSTIPFDIYLHWTTQFNRKNALSTKQTCVSVFDFIFRAIIKLFETSFYLKRWSIPAVIRLHLWSWFSRLYCLYRRFHFKLFIILFHLSSKFVFLLFERCLSRCKLKQLIYIFCSLGLTVTPILVFRSLILNAAYSKKNYQLSEHAHPFDACNDLWFPLLRRLSIGNAVKKGEPRRFFFSVSS